jgi:hypothetical protein
VHDAAVTDDHDPVGQLEQLVEVLAHQQHGGAGIPRGQEAIIGSRTAVQPGALLILRARLVNRWAPAAVLAQPSLAPRLQRAPI